MNRISGIMRCGVGMALPTLLAGMVMAQSAGNWTRQIPSTFPPPRYSAAMAYDTAHAQVVLFGGQNETVFPFNDTWTWDGANWTPKTPQKSPSARTGVAMAYDFVRGQMVLFGGSDFTTVFADTWTWDGSTWTQRSPVNSPPARSGHAMTYDSAHAQIVLFGGLGSDGKSLNDTWVWDGSNWIQKPTRTAPDVRSFTGMAFVPGAQTVLYGGFGELSFFGNYFNDTWMWDGSNWAQKSPQNVPFGRSHPAMAYDSAHGNVVMFAGLSNQPLNDTWTWNGSEWTRQSPQNSPNPLFGHSLAYDSAHAKVVLFGGRSTSSRLSLSETWTWDGGAVALTPQINVGGIVNNASYNLGSDGSSVAPGSITAIFGSNLTDGSSCLPPMCNPSFGTNGKLNTTMAGAQVSVGGTAVPIFYATPTQLGIQIPYELSGATVPVVVSVAARASTPSLAALAPVAPGIFTYTADGKGAGAITHVDGSAVTVQSPAHPGELVILYATGLGPVTPAVTTGALPAATSTTVSQVLVNIGGIAVNPDFAGLAGCCVGLNQINVRIPAGVTLGNAVPVILNISSKSSNSATIAVQ